MAVIAYEVPMIHLIAPADHERRVIFNLPPPFNLVWCDDVIHIRAIELCFLCYMRSRDQWLVDIESVLYEHIEIEFAEEMAEGFDHIVIDTVNLLLERIHAAHQYYTRGLESIVGYFDPRLIDYLEVECHRDKPDISFIVQPKDPF